MKSPWDQSGPRPPGFAELDAKVEAELDRARSAAAERERTALTRWRVPAWESHDPSKDTAQRTAEAVQAEREKIAGWLECTKDCQYRVGGFHDSGACHRIDDFCARYVAECIRIGAKP